MGTGIPTTTRGFSIFGISPLRDALLAGFLVFATFTGSAWLVRTKYLEREEQHLKDVLESAAWQAKDELDKTADSIGMGAVVRKFENLLTARSEIRSLSVLQKTGDLWKPVLHSGRQAGPEIPDAEMQEVLAQVPEGKKHFPARADKGFVTYLPVPAGEGIPVTSVIRVQSSPQFPGFALGGAFFLETLALAFVLACLSGFLVYQSTRRYQKAFHELAEAEKRLRDVADAAGEFIWEVNAQGLYVYLSGRTREVLGYEPEEMYGRHPFEFVYERDLPMVRRKSDSIVKAAVPFQNFEERMRRKDGSLVWVTVNGVPVKDDHGVLTGYRGATLDINERKANEEALIHEKEAAQSAAIAKNQFLAMMSHEIRTPLNSVIGFADVLADTPLSPSQFEDLEMIRRNGNALLVLLDDILLFSRAEAGGLSMHPQPTAIARFMESVVAIYRPSAVAKGISLELEVLPEVPNHLSLDPLRLRQIVLNLVGNAVKFTLEGRVVVRVEGGYQTEDPSKFDLRVVVEDTGVGISPEKAESLFEPFYQGDSSTTRIFGGTGLGLSICRRLASLLGGHVYLETSSPKGSRFVFVCPCRVAQPTENLVPTDSGRLLPDFKKCRVLVAEDNPANSRLLQILLRNLGCDCEIATNGKEAFAKHMETPFDLIFMDIQMPVMDGLVATGEIRRRERDRKSPKKVKIIALTANAMSGDKERCLQAGMNAYLSKPIRKQELETALRNLLWEDAIPSN